MRAGCFWLLFWGQDMQYAATLTENLLFSHRFGVWNFTSAGFEPLLSDKPSVFATATYYSYSFLAIGWQLYWSFFFGRGVLIWLCWGNWSHCSRCLSSAFSVLFCIESQFPHPIVFAVLTQGDFWRTWKGNGSFALKSQVCFCKEAP